MTLMHDLELPKKKKTLIDCDHKFTIFYVVKIHIYLVKGSNCIVDLIFFS